ncbi:tyrosine-type recombinase/integrase [Schinkia azotoformans]|uniref:tyrosine-type recombinase/integrase n=1 Tax=Schinkia azotoformans TaxID=1454 RepID=UPI002E2013C9|nr:tyrosine-type recombinase/integrase [Schinkia azotoformans]MED4351731.1 tyrosine-type recombinase/integrase [Schinkia azotoformans]
MVTKVDIYDVQPIRSKEKLEDMKWSLKKWCGQRDYILFLIGINTGLRAGDLVKLKVKDVKRKKKITVKEGKTKKARLILLTNIYDEIQAYIDEVDSVWLFPSRQGGSHVTTTQVYRQLVKAAKMVDIVECIGTHTMRKTFGYWFYKQTKDVAKLQQILNHSKPDVTLRYIGITSEEIEDSLSDFFL